MSLFKLHTPFPPAGSQPEAIKQLQENRPGKSTLLGVTGSGKTYTIANVIAQQDKPVLILAPNKTLAAQLYEEFSQFFPENKVLLSTRIIHAGTRYIYSQRNKS